MHKWLVYQELTGSFWGRLYAGDDIGDGILLRMNEMTQLPASTSWGNFTSIDAADKEWGIKRIAAQEEETIEEWAEMLWKPPMPPPPTTMDRLNLTGEEKTKNYIPIPPNLLIIPKPTKLIVTGIGQNDVRYLPKKIPTRGAPRTRSLGMHTLMIYHKFVNQYL